MLYKFKSIITQYILPPQIKKLVTRYLFSSKSWHFKGNYSSWEEVATISTGYSDQAILSKVLDSTNKVVQGEAAFERDGKVFKKEDYSWPFLSNLLWIAALKHGNLKVLDFGGALGSTYNQNKKYFDKLNVKWNIVEQKNYVLIGNENFKSDKLNFYFDISSSLKQNNIDIALFSGVLEFLPDPYEKIQDIIDSDIEFIIIDRSAFLKKTHDYGQDKFTVQHINNEIFPATLPFRFISMKKVHKLLLDHGYEIHQEYCSIGGEGASWEFKGLVASRNKDKNYV